MKCASAANSTAEARTLLALTTQYRREPYAKSYGGQSVLLWVCIAKSAVTLAISGDTVRTQRVSRASGVEREE